MQKLSPNPKCMYCTSYSKYNLRKKNSMFNLFAFCGQRMFFLCRVLQMFFIVFFLNVVIFYLIQFEMNEVFLMEIARHPVIWDCIECVWVVYLCSPSFYLYFFLCSLLRFELVSATFSNSLFCAFECYCPLDCFTPWAPSPFYSRCFSFSLSLISSVAQLLRFSPSVPSLYFYGKIETFFSHSFACFSFLVSSILFLSPWL